MPVLGENKLYLYKPTQEELLPARSQAVYSVRREGAVRHQGSEAVHVCSSSNLLRKAWLTLRRGSLLTAQQIQGLGTNKLAYVLDPQLTFGKLRGNFHLKPAC